MSRRPGTRQLDLLRAVQNGDVGGDTDTGEIWSVGYPVTKQVRAMEKAGWCTPVAGPDCIDWILTDSGRAEVEAVDGVPECLHERAKADDVECPGCGCLFDADEAQP